MKEQYLKKSQAKGLDGDYMFMISLVPELESSPRLQIEAVRPYVRNLWHSLSWRTGVVRASDGIQPRVASDGGPTVSALAPKS
ncbi:hypothetical protein PR048_014369 [Dryococelus australis]|uniref:Uncharacterized protein n=1 Tax=Dryococelus australis TaxID=614101 RepID=A0ABQ9HE19_9NEOP|nr:hypothetical protein PR048_014369 [Dryococelus australis]